MPADSLRDAAFCDVLNRELVCALGCTEPIAVAYCAALARQTLGTLPETVEVLASANIIKNVKSVIVPNTNGQRGIAAAAAAGIVADNADAQLQVLAELTPEQIETVGTYLEQASFTVGRSDKEYVFDIQVRVTAGADSAFVEIAGFHTNVIRVEKNGAVLQHKDYEESAGQHKTDRSLLTVENIIAFAKEAENPTLAGFLDEVALYTDLDNYDQSADCVTLMTMHAAKGLEFPTVFIIGCEEGIFPGLRCIGEPDEMEEERRLCYVALTRAREHLILTCARQRMLFGRTTANRVSRFVEEIPDEDIRKLNVPHGYGYSEPSRDQQQYPPRRSEPRAYTVSAPEPRRKPPMRPAPPAAKPAASAAPSFAVGDRVVHKAFGDGVVAAVKPMGGDALLEVDFESAGTKRLMMRAAGQFMKKKD